jgi:hypothetical protein
MSEPDPSFETRLESMERRLAEIQQELAPEAPPAGYRGPAPALAPDPVPEPEPAREPPPEPIPLRPRTTGATGAPRPAPRSPGTPAAVEVDVTVGPFTDTAGLHEFERALARLPGVRDVMVRGYKPGNRAIIEVQLEPKTS